MRSIRPSGGRGITLLTLDCNAFNALVSVRNSCRFLLLLLLYCLLDRYLCLICEVFVLFCFVYGFGAHRNGLAHLYNRIEGDPVEIFETQIQFMDIYTARFIEDLFNGKT